MQVIRYDAPGWGTGELWLEDGVLVNHELPSARGGGETASHPLAARMVAYFGGARADFADVELDLEWMTPFQGAVAETLRRVPYPVLVPCHRVVAANGLGSYGALGTDYKRRLLALEGVEQ